MMTSTLGSVASIGRAEEVRLVGRDCSCKEFFVLRKVGDGGEEFVDDWHYEGMADLGGV